MRDKHWEGGTRGEHGTLHHRRTSQLGLAGLEAPAAPKGRRRSVGWKEARATRPREVVKSTAGTSP